MSESCKPHCPETTAAGLGSHLSIRRGIVDRIVDDVKTEGSAETFYLASKVLDRLKSYKQLSDFSEAEDWILASRSKSADCRILHTGVLRESVRASNATGIGHLGTHAFRHAYRSWLEAVGTPVAVQQEDDAPCGRLRRCCNG